MAFYHAMCCFRVIQLTANWFYMFTILYQSEKVAVLNKFCLMIWLDFVLISTPFWNASLSVSIHLSALRQYKIPRFPSRHRFGQHSPQYLALSLSWPTFWNASGAGNVAPCFGVTDNSMINSNVRI